MGSCRYQQFWPACTPPLSLPVVFPLLAPCIHLGRPRFFSAQLQPPAQLRLYPHSTCPMHDPKSPSGTPAPQSGQPGRSVTPLCCSLHWEGRDVLLHHATSFLLYMGVPQGSRPSLHGATVHSAVGWTDVQTPWCHVLRLSLSFYLPNNWYRLFHSKPRPSPSSYHLLPSLLCIPGCGEPTSLCGAHPWIWPHFSRLGCRITWFHSYPA